MSKLSFGAVLNLSRENLGGSWDTLRDLTLECEEQGFRTAFLMDHFTVTESWARGIPRASDSVFLECWTALAALAASTKKIRLGPLVQCIGFRNPALTAKIGSSLDRISNGRLEFSMGAGWKEDEHISFGYKFPRPSVRMAELDEALIIVKKMWTERTPSFTGRYFSIENVEFGPLPMQKPHPPIWVGGAGEKLLLRVVARRADVWDIWCSPRQYAKKLEILRGHCESVGRQFGEIGLSISPPVFIARRREDALAKARAHAAPDTDVAEFIERVVAGSPEDCVDQISGYVDMGVTYFTPMVHTMSREDQRLFSESVMPHFL